ncbi:rhomboid family intramembrane serine protease [Pedobacter insulae]|uniref:Rhomboid-like protein n=1 Tax=Pedobacter insulae TaxID=414048 RepID=A0A1I2ZRD6_9SPHI|nr:rhomboid family intramembrane serine protease [Pedobacter insulae]SFH40452.1 rhomboid-like protein [Pedobacter insulae]
MNNIPPVVKNLLIINVLFFVAKWIFEQQGIPFAEYLAVFYFDSPFFKIWQPLTYMFMHANTMHIFFNMFALYSFGGILEAHWGPKRFINFYLITGFGALALQWAVQAFEVYQITGSAINNLDTLSVASLADLETMKSIYFGPMVGASGAIFGLLVAFAMLYPNIEMYIMFIPVPVKAKYIIPVYIVIELFLGMGKFAGDSVAHFAHLGGALIGYILVKLWRNKTTFYDYYD